MKQRLKKRDYGALFSQAPRLAPHCRLVSCSICVLSFLACNPVVNKGSQLNHEIAGAMTGAGAGAVSGFQLGAGSGAGAAVGAGVGAVAGGVRGLVQTAQAKQTLELENKIKAAKRRAEAQQTLASFYDVRLEWHPNREIYPAHIFFTKDSAELSDEGRALLEELYRLNRNRLPWSRLGVVAYVKSIKGQNDYALHLAERRAVSIANGLVRAGIEPRRIEAHGVTVTASVVQDTSDVKDSYAQAIEFSPIDR